ncbi:MAG: hypothetical protein KGL39_21075 [Patescibacteria group bacterium]|nr:hypothetical protein [Patescibacteria group bacterium]
MAETKDYSARIAAFKALDDARKFLAETCPKSADGRVGYRAASRNLLGREWRSADNIADTEYVSDQEVPALKRTIRDIAVDDFLRIIAGKETAISEHIATIVKAAGLEPIDITGKKEQKQDEDMNTCDDCGFEHAGGPLDRWTTCKHCEYDMCPLCAETGTHHHDARRKCQECGANCGEGGYACNLCVFSVCRGCSEKIVHTHTKKETEEARKQQEATRKTREKRKRETAEQTPATTNASSSSSSASSTSSSTSSSPSSSSSAAEPPAKKPKLEKMKELAIAGQDMLKSMKGVVGDDDFSALSKTITKTLADTFAAMKDD